MNSKELMQETIKKNNYFYTVMDAVRHGKDYNEISEYSEIAEKAKRVANNQMRIYNGIIETINTLKYNDASLNEIKNYENLAREVLGIFSTYGHDKYLYIQETMEYEGKEIPIAYYKKNADMSGPIKAAINQTEYKNNIEALVNGGVLFTQNIEDNTTKSDNEVKVADDTLNEYFRKAIVEGYWIIRVLPGARQKVCAEGCCKSGGMAERPGPQDTAWHGLVRK